VKYSRYFQWRVCMSVFCFFSPVRLSLLFRLYKHLLTPLTHALFLCDNKSICWDFSFCFGRSGLVSVRTANRVCSEQIFVRFCLVDWDFNFIVERNGKVKQKLLPRHDLIECFLTLRYGIMILSNNPDVDEHLLAPRIPTRINYPDCRSWFELYRISKGLL
jgi:hypothetical protein